MQADGNLPRALGVLAAAARRMIISIVLGIGACAPPIPHDTSRPGRPLVESDPRRMAEQYVRTRDVGFDTTGAEVSVLDGGPGSPVRAKVWFTRAAEKRALIVDIAPDGTVLGHEVVGIIDPTHRAMPPDTRPQ